MNPEYIKHYIVLDDGETYCELNPFCLVLSVTEEGQKFIEENGDSIKSLIAYPDAGENPPFTMENINTKTPLFLAESLTQYMKEVPF